MSTVTGLGVLVRLALRRDRVQLPAWILGLGLVVWASAASVQGLYPTEAERVAVASLAANNVVARAFDGPASGTSIGAITVVETFVLLAVLASLMSIFAVVRHTRQNEETGRAELVDAGVVGRHAGLTAALLVVLGANVVLGGVVAGVLVATGLPAAGSVMTGLALVGVGAVFTAVAAVTSQVLSTSRGANGAAAAVLGTAFLLRAIGDALGDVAPSGVEVVSAWPSWLSPIGWGQQVRPFHQHNGEPLLLLGGLAVLLLAAAAVLVSHRDVGTGMLPVRPGPARASGRLSSAFGLAWRLQRGVLLGWIVGLGVLAVAFGAIGDEAGEMIATSEQLAEAFAAIAGGADLVDAYLAVMMGLIGTITGGFVVQSLLRMRAEEASGTLEPLLATALARARWLASHVTVAVFGTLAILAVAGVGAGLAYGLAIGDVGDGLATLTTTALVQAPATLALAGFVVAVFGLLPRWSPALAWSGFAACLLMGQIGALLELPQAVLNLSPYTHVPAVPAVDLTVAPLAWLAAAALVLAAVGVLRFRQRDLAM